MISYVAEHADELEENDRWCTNDQSFCQQRGFLEASQKATLVHFFSFLLPRSAKVGPNNLRHVNDCVLLPSPSGGMHRTLQEGLMPHQTVLRMQLNFI
jgi:hypothetical protein